MLHLTLFFPFPKCRPSDSPKALSSSSPYQYFKLLQRRSSVWLVRGKDLNVGRCSRQCNTCLPWFFLLLLGRDRENVPRATTSKYLLLPFASANSFLLCSFTSKQRGKRWPWKCLDYLSGRMKKITKAIKTFWHLKKAAHERKRVLPFWANAKASVTHAKEQGYI